MFTDYERTRLRPSPSYNSAFGFLKAKRDVYKRQYIEYCEDKQASLQLQHVRHLCHPNLEAV